MSVKGKKIHPFEMILKGLIWLFSILVVVMLVGIIGYVFVKGLPFLSWELISTVPSELKGTFGILPVIINTIYIVVLTLVIATPIGIGGAIYLNEYAKKGRLIKIIELTTEVLTGIPSIIYGLFGFVFFGTFLGLGYSILTGVLTLSIMILPTIIRTTQEALKTVPESYKEGALSLGSKKIYIIFTILIPSALPGIITAVILAMGRIVGESAALIFTAGTGLTMVRNIFGHVFTSGASLTVQLYSYAMRGEDPRISFAIASILIIIILILNFLAKFLGRKLNRNK